MTVRSRTSTFRALGPLCGEARLPGDKSISHRALLLAALAEGTSCVSGLADGDDVVRTRGALAQMGIEFDGPEIHGGRDRFREPERPLDMGNSGTGTRLLAGLCASLPFLSVLVGDESIHRRPMDRVTLPLRQMGAVIDGREHGRLCPLVIRGGGLAGIDYTPPVASAQVKSAILLAGIAASGTTTVREKIATRRHTEEMLAMAGGDVSSTPSDVDYVATVRASTLEPFEIEVPKDPSQAAFFVVAALLVPGSQVRCSNVYVGPGRAGFLEVLRRMGADLELTERKNGAADIVARHSRLTATRIGGAEIPSLIDELPVLAVAAAFAKGTTVVTDAAELRVKESDRIETLSTELRAIGARIETAPDGFSIEGSGLDPHGRVDSHGDHRIAMSLAIAGLTGTRSLEVSGFESVDTSWPGFEADLAALSCS